MILKVKTIRLRDLYVDLRFDLDGNGTFVVYVELRCLQLSVTSGLRQQTVDYAIFNVGREN